MEPDWVDKNGVPAQWPTDCGTLQEAIDFLRSIYDANQTGQRPPTFPLPPSVIGSPALLNLVRIAENDAATRTRTALWHMEDHREQRRRKVRLCCVPRRE